MDCTKDGMVVIQGGAAGADSLARSWAAHSGVVCLTFKANWKAHGKGAGPQRNQRMLDEGRPELVVAFRGGRGTIDMVRRASKANVMLALTDPALNQYAAPT